MSQLDSFKKTLSTLVVAGTAAFAAGEANAQEVIALDPMGPAESSVEWVGATSESSINYTISGTADRANRVIDLVTTPGSKVKVSGACPAPSSRPGWKLNVSKKPKNNRRDSATVISTSLERSGEDGTFDVGFVAPTRADKNEMAQLSCDKHKVDENGEIIAGTDAEVEDSEILTLIVRTRKNVTPGYTPRQSNFFYSVPRESATSEELGAAGSSRKKGEVEGQLDFAVSGVTNTNGSPATKPAVDVGARANLGKGAGRWSLGGDYRFAVVKEDAEGAHGGKVAVDDGAKVHALTAEGGWNPGSDAVRGRLSVGGGLAHVEEYRTGPHSKIDGESGFIARARAAIEVAFSKNFGLKAEVEGDTGTLKLLNSWEIGGGAYWRFQ